MKGVWGSFRLVSLLASKLSLLAPPPSAGRPASLLHCAGLCLQEERCGGVAWLATDVSYGRTAAEDETGYFVRLKNALKWKKNRSSDFGDLNYKASTKIRSTDISQ
jgi:hypothetical protein